jgi:hypothetical protein
MLDISTLERRWIKYKIKKLLPYTLITTAVLIMIFLLPSFFFEKQSSKPSISVAKHSKTKKTVAVKNLHSNELPMTLEPSMHFMESIGVPSVSPITPIPKSAPIQQQRSSASPMPVSSLPVQEQQLKVPLPVVVKPIQPLTKSKLTSIKRDDTTFDIHEIEDRFKENSNPNLGVYIARYHYDHGNYSEAYNYALKTNSINSSMDDSWLIFAKSLVKLGKEEQAKKTLQLYISNSNSLNAKNYLDSLNKENNK